MERFSGVKAETTEELMALYHTVRAFVHGRFAG